MDTNDNDIDTYIVPIWSIMYKIKSKQNDDIDKMMNP